MIEILRCHPSLYPISVRNLSHRCFIFVAIVDDSTRRCGTKKGTWRFGYEMSCKAFKCTHLWPLPAIKKVSISDVNLGMRYVNSVLIDVLEFSFGWTNRKHMMLIVQWGVCNRISLDICGIARKIKELGTSEILAFRYCMYATYVYFHCCYLLITDKMCGTIA